MSMKALLYDCGAGISGDMNLAALIDLGVDLNRVEKELGKLHLHGEWELKCSRGAQSGIHGTRIDVVLHEGHHHNEDHHHRTMQDIRHILEGSSLNDFVKSTALSIFTLLAEAEATVHGTTPDKVHFHEVGAVDSIIDIVGSAICLDLLQADAIFTGPVELGGGQVRCQHGIMPVPAPATALLARHFQASLGGTPHEATTPTGAAYIAAVAEEVPTPFNGRILRTGYGLGHRQGLTLPNILRVMLVEMDDQGMNTEHVTELCANIDDMTPEQTAYLMEKLMEAGALDAWQESICMKKGRMASKVCALCGPSSVDVVRRVFFLHSSTHGIRAYDACRHVLHRESIPVETRLGTVRVKTSFLDGKPHHRKAEYEDCKALAEAEGLPLAQCQMLGISSDNEHGHSAKTPV